MPQYEQLLPPIRRTRRFLPEPEPGQERRTFGLHLLSAAMGALASGVILNHEYIAAKGLDASVWQVTFLVMIWPVSNVLSVFINHWIERSGSYSKAVLLAGVPLRLPIALMWFSSDASVMLGLLLLFFSSNSVVIPAQNAVIRARYREGQRGVLFGWVMSAFTLFSLPAAMIVGSLLDLDFGFYRVLFVVEGVAGAGQALVIGLITGGMEMVRPRRERDGDGFLRSLFRVFRRDKEFAAFESFFMLYGIGFMIVLPAIPFFAQDVLRLSYEQYATAKGVIGQIGMLLLGPFMGIRVERLHPFRFTGLACLVLGLYPITIFMGNWIPALGIVFFYAGYSIYSLGMAGINMSWNMSSLHFAPEGQAATYQGLHITLTALRGMVAPVAGSIVMDLFGYTAPFMLSTFFFMLAGTLFLRRYLRHR
ncbi:MFS transporter [Candidatus Fermentibacterales bacterium]|nr:MFS transporter [Candidatus Fermentibacterales bacterium]